VKKFLALSASLALSALSAAACVCSSPRCYFAGDVGTLQQTELGELWLVGRHFFPEWIGTSPRGNDIVSSEAHALDFATAAARAGAIDATGDYERYRERAERWELAVHERRDWLPPFVPVPEEERAAWPAYAKQFYLYSLGRAQLLADSTLSAPPAWEELLALPAEERKERTVWALHGKVLAAKGFAAADGQLRALRAACDEGFTDTCGLEAAILRRLLLRDPAEGLRWLPLVLAAYGEMPSEEREWHVPFNVHRMLSVAGGAERLRGERSERDVALLSRAADEFAVWRRKGDWRVRAALADDPVGREILFVLDGGDETTVPSAATALSTPLLSADRAAWRAFERGEYAAAKVLLAYAPADSLLRLFLEARFARMDGDLPLAAEKLRAWLRVCRERGGEGDWCDFAILDEDCGDDWGNLSTVPWPRYVAGSLGMVLVEQRDFVEALGVFLRDALSWRDAAFIAERCLTRAALEEAYPSLAEYMASTEEGSRHAGKLASLLARRCMRENRPDLAGAWFERAVEEERRLFERLDAEKQSPRWIYGEPFRRAGRDLALWRARQKTAEKAYAQTNRDLRAAAFVDLARLERSAGMELYATELEPDVGLHDGEFSTSGFPAGEAAAERAANWRVVADLPRKRWHWRVRAAKTARRAAAMAESEGVKAAALLLAGVFTYADEKEADEAFQMLADLPAHPAGAYARKTHWLPDWGGGAVSDFVARDNRREPEEWLAGGWECTPESLAALADAALAGAAAEEGDAAEGE